MSQQLPVFDIRDQVSVLEHSDEGSDPETANEGIFEFMANPLKKSDKLERIPANSQLPSKRTLMKTRAAATPTVVPEEQVVLVQLDKETTPATKSAPLFTDSLDIDISDGWQEDDAQPIDDEQEDHENEDDGEQEPEDGESIEGNDDDEEVDEQDDDEEEDEEGDPVIEQVDEDSQSPVRTPMYQRSSGSPKTTATPPPFRRVTPPQQPQRNTRSEDSPSVESPPKRRPQPARGFNPHNETPNEIREKTERILHMKRMAQLGTQFTREYTMHDTIDDVRFEHDTVINTQQVMNKTNNLLKAMLAAAKIIQGVADSIFKTSGVRFTEKVEEELNAQRSVLYDICKQSSTKTQSNPYQAVGWIFLSAFGATYGIEKLNTIFGKNKKPADTASNKPNNAGRQPNRPHPPGYPQYPPHPSGQPMYNHPSFYPGYSMHHPPMNQGHFPMQPPAPGMYPSQMHPGWHTQPSHPHYMHYPMQQHPAQYQPPHPMQTQSPSHSPSSTSVPHATTAQTQHPILAQTEQQPLARADTAATASNGQTLATEEPKQETKQDTPAPNSQAPVRKRKTFGEDS